MSARFRVKTRNVLVYAMCLDAGAVELPLDARGAELREGSRDISCRLRQHGCDRLKRCQSEGGQAVELPPHRRLGDRLEVSCQHRGSPDLCCRHTRRLRHRLGHHPLECPRSSPRKRPTRSRCSGSVARPSSDASSSRRAACDPGPAIACTRDTGSIDLQQLERRWRARGRRQLTQCRRPTPTVPCGSSPER